MYKNSKIARARDYIEEKCRKDEPAIEDDFLAKNPDVTSATYYDAWKAVQIAHAGESRFLNWAEGIRLGRTGPNKQARIWTYLESRFEKHLPVQRQVFLQNNADIPIKTFDSSLLRWLKSKEQGNNPKFHNWNSNIRCSGGQKGLVIHGGYMQTITSLQPYVKDDFIPLPQQPPVRPRVESKLDLDDLECPFCGCDKKCYDGM